MAHDTRSGFGKFWGGSRYVSDVDLKGPNLKGFDTTGAARGAVNSLWNARGISPQSEATQFEMQNAAMNAQKIQGSGEGQTAVAQGLATGLGQTQVNNQGMQAVMQEQGQLTDQALQGSRSYQQLSEEYMNMRKDAEMKLQHLRDAQDAFNRGQLKKDDLNAVLMSATSAVLGAAAAYDRLKNRDPKSPTGQAGEVVGEVPGSGSGSYPSPWTTETVGTPPSVIDNGVENITPPAPSGGRFGSGFGGSYGGW